jgi:hypothetical protein
LRINARKCARLSDNSHRYRLYEAVLFLHASNTSRSSRRRCTNSSTHGGFNGPYGKKVKTVWTQEGRTRKGQARGSAHGEERQARRKAQEQRPQSDGAQGDGAQEDSAQGGAEEGRIHEHGDGDAVDGSTAGRARGTEAADADAKPGTASGDTAAAASGDAVLRLVQPVESNIDAEAVGELVLPAEAARQQLGQRRLERRRLLELLADGAFHPSPRAGEGCVASQQRSAISWAA